MSSPFDAPQLNARLFFPRHDRRPPPVGARDLWIDVEPNVRLHARVHDAPAAGAAVLMFHGNGETVADYDALAPAFARAGASLAVVSYRGYGQSTGVPTARTCLSDARQVLAPMRAALSHAGVPLPLVIMGRSLGSASAAELARVLPRNAAGFVLESGFVDLTAMVRRRGMVPPARFDEADMETFDPRRKLARVRAPALVLHGENDTLISPDEGRAAFEALGTRDKRLVLLAGRGHNDVQASSAYWDALADFIAHAARQADRRAGALVVQALGDALGFLIEGHHPVLCAAFADETFGRDAPPNRTRGPFAFGQYSDDTQLARELGLTLIEAEGWEPARFAARLANLFARDAIVGQGRATEAAAERLIAGVPWDRAGEPPPRAGNGAAMRAAPVGLALADPNERFRVTDEQARVTHLDPRARAAAVLVADVVADAVAHGVAPRDAGYYAGLARRVGDLDPTLAAGVERIPAWMAMAPEAAAREIASAGEPPAGTASGFEQWHGISPFATPSVLYALYAYERSPGDPAGVLRTAIAVGGDVDTVAAMAGAMVGAAVGLGGLEPRLRRWAERLNDQGAFGIGELAALGHALA